MVVSRRKCSFYVNVWILRLFTVKKIMFLHKLVKQNYVCLNVFFCFKRSTKFLSLRRFDLVINQCSASNVKCNVFQLFLWTPAQLKHITFLVDL